PEGVIDDEHAPRAPFPGYVYLERATHLSWYERITWPLHFRAPARGYYRLGPVRISTGDIFGFYPVLKEEEKADAVIIYPRIYTLPDLGLPPERPFGELKG